MKIKITSDGQTFSMIDEDSGFEFPLRKLEYSIGMDGVGVLHLEMLAAGLPDFSLELAPRPAPLTASDFSDFLRRKSPSHP